MENCKECNKIFETKKALFIHISKKHNNKLYYDKWINTVLNNCEICGAQTDFLNLRLGYKKYCNKHYHEWNYIQIKNATFKKYGVNSFLCLQDIKEAATIKKYGVKNVFMNEQIKEKIKKTNMKKYGVDNPFKSEEIKEKIKKTNMKKYGVNYPSQSKDIQNKIKQSFKNHYGVEYALQNKKLHEQQLKSSYYSKKYKDTDINYRASYELDFLEKFYDKYPDIQNASPIKYEFLGKKKYIFQIFIFLL
jgi:uncharacterized alkaline shock family protein YloU